MNKVKQIELHIYETMLHFTFYSKPINRLKSGNV